MLLGPLTIGVMLTAFPARAAEGIPMYFPVAGPATYGPDFGYPRPGGRQHQGVDIFADKGIPVLAVADGIVEHAGEGVRAGYFLVLRHPDGWTSWYLHLNDDSRGTDDGQGFGWLEGISVGVSIEGGDPIGWVGDSGNAEGTSPHLHFELHMPDGTVVDPYPYLQAAAPAPEVEIVGLADWSAGIVPTTLPFTGSSPGGLAGLAILLLALGRLLVGLASPAGRHSCQALVIGFRGRGRHSPGSSLAARPLLWSRMPAAAGRAVGPLTRQRSPGPASPPWSPSPPGGDR